MWLGLLETPSTLMYSSFYLSFFSEKETDAFMENMVKALLEDLWFEKNQNIFHDKGIELVRPF